MNDFWNAPITKDRLWFGLLGLYLMTGYFAQDILIPSIVNSLVLYIFLAFSAFFILFSGKLKISAMIVWELAYLGLALFATLYGPQGAGFSGTYYSMIVNFILILIFTQMPWSTARVDYIFKVFLYSSVGLLIALAMTGKLEDTSESGRLGQELMGNANILAIMLMVSAIYALYLMVTAKRARVKILYFLGVVVIYIGMFLSGGRKYIIIPLIFLYVFLLVKGDAKGKKRFIRNTIIIGVVVFVIFELIMKSPIFYNSIGQRFTGFFALFDESYELDGSLIKRQRMIDAAWDGWLQSPLFGHGFDSFKYYNQQSVTGHFYYSHNNFVELLYNQGLVGFIGYYSFYVYLFAKALKEKQNLVHKGFVLATVCALLAFEYGGITYSVTPPQLLLFFCCHLLNSDASPKKTFEKMCC